MSQFHGGFLVRRVDASMQAPVVETLRQELQEARVELDDLFAAFSVRRGAPLTHIAVRGGEAEGKGYCWFHSAHAELAAPLARALETDVWATCYENQSGYEMFTRYDALGRQVERDERAWSLLAQELKLRDNEEGRARLMEALPLGRLAATLHVPRELLDRVLPLETPSCRVPLGAAGFPDALERYLAGALLPVPERMPRGVSTAISVYFPPAMADEAQALANRLGVRLSTVVWAAWECAKAGLYEETTGVDDEGAALPPLPAPPARLAPELAIPEEAPELSPLAVSPEKAVLGLVLPPALVAEVRALASHADRTLSWMLQAAWLRARARLHAARHV